MSAVAAEMVTEDARRAGPLVDAFTLFPGELHLGSDRRHTALIFSKALTRAVCGSDAGLELRREEVGDPSPGTRGRIGVIGGRSVTEEAVIGAFVDHEIVAVADLKGRLLLSGRDHAGTMP